MDETLFVTLHYGPYASNCGIVRHKPQRLHGIVECLSKLGYEIEIVPSMHLDRLTVEILDREVFRCNIKNLQFNINCQADRLSQRVVEAVQEATSRMYAIKNFPRYHPVSEGTKIIRRIKYSRNTQDLLSSNIKLWYEIPKIVKKPYDMDLRVEEKAETENKEEKQEEREEQEGRNEEGYYDIDSSGFSLDAGSSTASTNYLYNHRVYN